jgi:hypothetical protein
MMNIDGQREQVFGTLRQIAYLMDTEPPGSDAEGATPPEDVEPELEEAARREREYLRERLREELGREPTPEEMDEWLRRHTEGY